MFFPFFLDKKKKNRNDRFLYLLWNMRLIIGGYGTFFFSSLFYRYRAFSFFLSFFPFFSRFLMLCWSTFSITERQKIPIDPKCFRSTANEIIWYIYIYICRSQEKGREIRTFFLCHQILSFSLKYGCDIYVYIYSNEKKTEGIISRIDAKRWRIIKMC